MGKIADHLRENYKGWGWLGQRAHDAAGINAILPLDMIISCDNGTEIPLYFRDNDVLSLEKNTGYRYDWSNEDLKKSLRGELGAQVTRRFKGCTRRFNLICYRSIRILEKKSVTMPPVRIYAVKEHIKRRFDNKALFFRYLSSLPYPRIKGMTTILGKRSFKVLAQDLSLPFVVQLPYGSSGNNTFIINTGKEYSDLTGIYGGRLAVVRRYMKGFSLNVNALVLSGPAGVRALCMYPSIQITGAPECSNSPASFCGNDYSSVRQVDPVVLRQVKEHVMRTGEWMASSGFRGLFGMDFIVSDGTVFPVEVNPRFQNSTALHTSSWIRSNDPEKAPFIPHVAEFLQGEDSVLKRYLSNIKGDELMLPIEGAQVILHNRQEHNTVSGRVRPGIYRLADNGIKFIKESACLGECRDGGDMLVTCGVPAKDVPVAPNAPLCKIQTLGRAVDPGDLKNLTADMRRMVRYIYGKLRLTEMDRKAMAFER